MSIGGGDGFSEAALKALDEMDARAALAEAYERALSLQGEARPRPDDRPHYWGHRERLRQRFLSAGPNGLPDYEILELILFNAIPRIDVKPLAKTLIAEFGDFNGVIAAPDARLKRVAGVTPKVVIQLRLHAEVGRRMARAEVMGRSVITSWDALLRYCKTAMAHNDIEQFRVLFLDRKNALVADEAQARGTVDHVPVYPREVAKRALELNASAIILVHNHPSGDPTPSQADIDMTRKVEIACEAIGVRIHDHLVIGKASDVSFRELGYL